MEEKYYSLTTGQELIAFTNEYLPKGAMNLCTRIDISQNVNEVLLLESIRLTTGRIPSLNLRLTKDENNSFIQYISKEQPETIEVIDGTEWSEKKIEKKLVEWSGKEFPNHLLEVQLYKIRVIKTNKGFIIVFMAHHLLMDAYAIMALIKYMDRVYYSLENNLELPKEMPSPEEMLNKEGEYLSSKRYISDKAWFEEVFSKKMDFKPFVPKRKLSIRAKMSNPFTTKNGFKNMLIEKDVISKIEEFALENHTSSGNIFTMAISMLVAENTDSDDVVINAIVSRRSTMLQKEGGCSLANALPLRCMIDRNDSFNSMVEKFSIIIKELYKHSGFITSESYEMLGASADNDKLTPADLVSVTYQPYFNLTNNRLDFTAQRISPGRPLSKFYISIMPYDNTGNMYANYEYFGDIFKDEEVEEFHNKMIKFIKNGMACPQKTVKELLELSNA